MRFLRARKMNAEDAFEVYVNFYRFRHNNPELFVGIAIGNAEVQYAMLNVESSFKNIKKRVRYVSVFFFYKCQILY